MLWIEDGLTWAMVACAAVATVMWLWNVVLGDQYDSEDKD